MWGRSGRGTLPFTRDIDFLVLNSLWTKFWLSWKNVSLRRKLHFWVVVVVVVVGAAAATAHTETAGDDKIFHLSLLCTHSHFPHTTQSLSLSISLTLCAKNKKTRGGGVWKSGIGKEIMDFCCTFDLEGKGGSGAWQKTMTKQFWTKIDPTLKRIKGKKVEQWMGFSITVYVNSLNSDDITSVRRNNRLDDISCLLDSCVVQGTLQRHTFKCSLRRVQSPTTVKVFFI